MNEEIISYFIIDRIDRVVGKSHRFCKWSKPRGYRVVGKSRAINSIGKTIKLILNYFNNQNLII